MTTVTVAEVFYFTHITTPWELFGRWRNCVLISILQLSGLKDIDVFHRVNGAGERVASNPESRSFLVTEQQSNVWKVTVLYLNRRIHSWSNPSPPISVGHGHALQRSPSPTWKSSSQVHPTLNPSADLARRFTSVSFITFWFLIVFFESENRTLSAAQTVIEGRQATENIIKGDDDRLMVVVGCVPTPIPNHSIIISIYCAAPAPFTMSIRPSNTLNFFAPTPKRPNPTYTSSCEFTLKSRVRRSGGKVLLTIQIWTTPSVSIKASDWLVRYYSTLRNWDFRLDASSWIRSLRSIPLISWAGVRLVHGQRRVRCIESWLLHFRCQRDSKIRRMGLWGSRLMRVGLHGVDMCFWVWERRDWVVLLRPRFVLCDYDLVRGSIFILF